MHDYEGFEISLSILLQRFASRDKWFDIKDEQKSVSIHILELGPKRHDLTSNFEKVGGINNQYKVWIRLAS